MKATLPSPQLLSLLFRSAVLAVTLLLWICSGFAAVAQSQAACGSYDDLRAGLADRWAEAPIGSGFLNEGAVLVLFSDMAGDTWTLVLRRADGSACVVASGTGWAAIPVAPAGREG